MEMETQELAGCARCPFEAPLRACQSPDGKAPPFCPTRNRPEVTGEALRELEKPDILEFARQASIQEGEGYAGRELGYDQVRPAKPRVVEVIEFADRMRYRKLGLAFCMGLRREARVVEGLLEKNGFAVVSGICKVGGVPKERIGLRDEQKIRIGGFEPMCNPIAQALLLNEARTDFNILMGLCVGHDSLFLKYAEAPCTVLAVKDRLLGHNPLAAVYTIDGYYRSLKTPLRQG
jgi:uncharacterized metal-binding protein